ncbi:ABC transporter ATP-binding protein [Vagococcus sp. BWB3-3]|uniref:ABC transporter ATP-binding protein n=1 Tax=Vagococcus allomyrinae TaxID=2794353 RepID=A0A940P703_9ENTE|nr:ABC transporter ATP-binding protein [Vagococcus allomyrinae]MBP1040906.1 ABC transporter ATP-binding protein [Vagococcus allomyrinae]
MSIIQTVDLTKTYGEKTNQVDALKQVNLSIDEGEFVAIVGSSGSGKSTLLHLIGGLDFPTSGDVLIRGQHLSQMKQTELTIFRRRNLGFVFQSYNLMPILSVYENIVLPLKLDGVTIDEEFVMEVVEKLKISDKLAQMPNQLSGGQQQRVAIARALVARPTIILADEPTGNLDSQNTIEVVGFLKTLAFDFHQTIAVVTHDEKVAQLADRIIKIEDGQIAIGKE